MKQQLVLVCGALTVLCASWSLSAGEAAPGAPALAFEELGMHYEVDLPSSGDRESYGVLQARLLGLPAELVLQVKSPRPFTRLRVLDSAWRTVFDLSQPRRTASGLAEIELESEGETLRELLENFPCGAYFVEATCVDGVLVEGFATLKPRLPGFFGVVVPLPGERVAHADLTLAWTPSEGAAGYSLEIEQEELDFSLEIQLPPSQTSFRVPAHVLLPGQTYEYSLAVRGDTDNELEVEGKFFVSSPGQ